MTTLVGLHGFLGAPGGWASALARDNLVEPRLPFHGIPPVHAQCTSWAQALELLEAELPPGPVALLGYSLGARLALGLAERLGARVVAAVLVSVHAGLAASEREERARFERAMAARLESSDTMRPFVDHWESLPLFATQAQLAPNLQQAQRRAREQHLPAVVADAFRVLGTSRMPHYETALGSLRMPVLFLSGARDGKYDALAARYARAAARGTHASIAGCGHNPLLEAPRTVARLVADLLPLAQELR